MKKVFKLKINLQLSETHVEEWKDVKDDSLDVIRVNNAECRGGMIEQKEKICQSKPKEVLICCGVMDELNEDLYIAAIKTELNREFDNMVNKMVELRKI